MADDHSGAHKSGGLKELEVVRLRSEQRTADGVWPAGALGAIVFVHEGGRAFEVEFSSPPGVLTLDQTALAAA